MELRKHGKLVPAAVRPAAPPNLDRQPAEIIFSGPGELTKAGNPLPCLLPQRWRDGHWWWLVTAKETVPAGPDYKNQTCRRARQDGLIKY